MDPIAVYVHTPFCPSKCGYCDFNSYAMQGEIMERTTRAIEAEIASSELKGVPAKTIFFGGGTPTFLEERQLIRILEAVLRAHPPVSDSEVTSEANPGTVDASKFKAMRSAGFNRISLGAQSFSADDLLRLGRIHSADHVSAAVESARKAGFHNLNLDLMFALPQQNQRAWEANLEKALALQPEHLSLYCLTIEHNTPFYKEHLRGTLVQPDEDVQVQMYEKAVSEMEDHGYLQYEISNFARPGFECRHNLCYWLAENYVGYGPGAVGAYGEGSRVRYTNLKHPERYCQAVDAGEALRFDIEPLGPDIERTEKIMLGLRLNRGVPVDVLQVDLAKVSDLTQRGWLETNDGRVRLTPSGRHFHNEVVVALM